MWRTRVVTGAVLVLATSVFGPDPAAASARAGVAALDQEVASVIAEHGGIRTALNEITWDNNERVAVLSLPLPAVMRKTAATSQAVDYQFGCPHGYLRSWYCFYENTNFNGIKEWGEVGPGNGRLLKWSEKHCNLNHWVDFADYHFRDRVSSWVNMSDLTVAVANWRVKPNYDPLWIEDPESWSAYVGDAHNDAADFFESC